MTGKLIGHVDVSYNHLPASVAFWLKRFNHLRLFDMTIFNADSDIFTIPAIEYHVIREIFRPLNPELLAVWLSPA